MKKHLIQKGNIVTTPDGSVWEVICTKKAVPYGVVVLELRVASEVESRKVGRLACQDPRDLELFAVRAPKARAMVVPGVGGALHAVLCDELTNGYKLYKTAPAAALEVANLNKGGEPSCENLVLEA